MIFTGSGKCFFFFFLFSYIQLWWLKIFSAIYSFLQGNGIAQRHPLFRVSLGVVCVCVCGFLGFGPARWAGALRCVGQGPGLLGGDAVFLQVVSELHTKSWNNDGSFQSQFNVYNAPNRSVSLLQELSPSLLKELPHVVSRTANVRVVLVKLLTVVEHQVDINDERLEVLVPKDRERPSKSERVNRHLGLNIWSDTHWLLTSFSRIVEKSMGFLMTLRYPGTDLRFTGVRKGQASWWRSSSAKRILHKKTKWYKQTLQRRRSLSFLSWQI